jgi:hypothetical protein
MAPHHAKFFTQTFGPEQQPLRLPRRSRKARKRGSAPERAARALKDLGKWKKLTIADVAGIHRVSATYVAALHRLPPHLQQDVCDGFIKLSDVVNKRARQQAIADKADALIAKVGVEPVFAALDRATKPTNGNGHHTD